MIIRAVIYARCSTEDESQKDALANQIQEAGECVRSKGWALVDTYIESRSGTTTKGRTEYNRLYGDLQKDLFDIIVIKSQDRLMRNTKDWYLFVDRLCTNGKRLYIYIEKKFYTADDALITGIKAILAEEYSRELSKKINNAHRNRQKNDGSLILTSNAYGFRRLPDKSVELVESEAQVKRRMYQLCADGYGSRRIAKALTEEGITKRSGRPFSGNDILRMLKNPLNMGTAVMNRKHFNFETKQVEDVPVRGQFWHENKVPATVPEELWREANRQIKKRADRFCRKEGYFRHPKEGASGKFCFSGKILCGLCGQPYYRRCRKTDRGHKTVIEWKCSTYLLEGKKGCNNIHLREDRMFELLGKICMEQFQVDKEQIICEMTRLLGLVFAERDGAERSEQLAEQEKSIKRQQDRLVDLFLSGVIMREVYERKQTRLDKELRNCREKRKRLEQKKIYIQSKEQRVRRIEKSLREENMIEQAAVCEMMQRAGRIRVCPTHLDISLAAGRELTIPCETMFDSTAGKRKEREKVIEMIREHPQITAREIAVNLGCSLSGANYKLRVLKKEGRIRFTGKGGHGFWEVLGE